LGGRPDETSKPKKAFVLATKKNEDHEAKGKSIEWENRGAQKHERKI